MSLRLKRVRQTWTAGLRRCTARGGAPAGAAAAAARCQTAARLGQGREPSRRPPAGTTRVRRRRRRPPRRAPLASTSVPGGRRTGCGGGRWRACWTRGAGSGRWAGVRGVGGGGCGRQAAAGAWATALQQASRHPAAALGTTVRRMRVHLRVHLSPHQRPPAAASLPVSPLPCARLPTAAPLCCSAWPTWPRSGPRRRAGTRCSTWSWPPGATGSAATPTFQPGWRGSGRRMPRQRQLAGRRPRRDGKRRRERRRQRRLPSRNHMRSRHRLPTSLPATR